MPAPENTPDAPPAAELPIETLNPEPAADSPDFMSAIDKAFELAEQGEKPAENKEVVTDKKTPDTKEVVTDTAKVVSPKAADFAKVKADRDQFKTNYETAQAKIKEYEDKISAAETTAKEAAELREKLAHYEKEVSAVRVEASPEYAKVVTEPANRIRLEADRLASKYKLDRDKVVSTLAEADPSRQGDIASELASSMNQRDQFQFYQLIDDFNAVIAKREELQSKSQDVWQEIQQTRDKAASVEKESARKAWKSAEEEVWGAIEKRVPNVTKIPNIQGLRDQVAAKPISELTPKEQAYSSMAGLMLPHLVVQAKAADAKIKELETALAKFRQATPGAGGGVSSEATSTASDQSMGGFLDSIERKINGG